MLSALPVSSSSSSSSPNAAHGSVIFRKAMVVLPGTYSLLTVDTETVRVQQQQATRF